MVHQGEKHSSERARLKLLFVFSSHPQHLCKIIKNIYVFSKSFSFERNKYGSTFTIYIEFSLNGHFFVLSRKYNYIDTSTSFRGKEYFLTISPVVLTLFKITYFLKSKSFFNFQAEHFPNKNLSI